MKINVLNCISLGGAADTKIVLCYMGGETIESIHGLNGEILEKLIYLITEKEFEGQAGEILSLNLAKDVKPNKVIFVGLGEKSKLCKDVLRKAIGKAVKESIKLKSKVIELSLVGMEIDSTLYDFSRIISETAILADYKFDKYLQEKKTSSINELNLICEEMQYNEVKKASDEGCILGSNTVAARNLINEPANVLLPIKLAEEAQAIGRKCGFDVEIYDERKIAELDMQAFLEVSRGAVNPPRLIIMKYFGDEANKDKRLGLVGKGLTYDSGGYSLKPKTSMIGMKNDMAGAAAVIGAMAAIAQMKLKINVVSVVAACENMLSGDAYRPGDIIRSMAGKTILIKSTDAEGRLTLADAVYYIVEKEGVQKVVDIATLTGAAKAAFGREVTAIVSNDDEFYSMLEAASKNTSEKIWRAPSFDDYKPYLKCDIADLANSSDGPGMIVGGLFIGEFVQGRPWIHMDIAGSAWTDKELEYTSIGATGCGVASLYYLAKAF